MPLNIDKGTVLASERTSTQGEITKAYASSTILSSSLYNYYSMDSLSLHHSFLKKHHLDACIPSTIHFLNFPVYAVWMISNLAGSRQVDRASLGWGRSKEGK